MQLKDHLQRCLDILCGYFRLVVQCDGSPGDGARQGAKLAFEKIVAKSENPDRRYREVPGLEGMPYVCLRVPTGGGKTFMAAHAVGVAAQELLHAERVVCLWLVPTNIIMEQTLKALKNRQHPYRQALDTAFAGKIVVANLADALYLSHGDANGATVVLVSTLAALRVEDTDGRKIYENNGNLQPHFVSLDDALKATLEKEGDGSVIHSLANVLRLHRPVVIMDEAHRARTRLSFDTLTRFAPSCVIELTATPEMKHNPTQGVYGSNILHHVSARELKEAEMIKLPVKLRTRADWKQVLSDAIAKRKELEALADAYEKLTGEYIRPLMVIQAQKHNKNKPTLTFEVVKQTLIEEYQIPEEQIAIATGQTREIDDVDLFGRIPIRYIITVDALREGWDCSFAYVLCSLAEQHSATSVEQILGRVLRMPRAKKKLGVPDLNIAYAFAAAASWIKTAEALKDGMVENGFHALEAKDFVQPAATEQATFDDGSMFGTTTEAVSEAPNLAKLEPALRERLAFDETTKELAFTGIMADTELAVLKDCFKSDVDRKAVERIHVRSQGRSTRADVPAAVPEPFRVPMLAVRVGTELELFGEEHYLNTPWDLAKCDFSLTEKEFPSSWHAGDIGEIDATQRGRLEMTHFVADLHDQLECLTGESGWQVPRLAGWFDQNIRHPDIPQWQSATFIHRLLTSLMETRHVSVEQLARIKHRLRDVIERKIKLHRDANRGRAIKSFLFGDDSSMIEVDPAVCFTFDEDRYAPNWYYDGAYHFKCHRPGQPGELKADGEEYHCAVYLDQMTEMGVWFRNIPRRSTSFWLPTATDKFYPDFVCRLRDSRYLAVEYKGEDRSTNDDSKEKRAVGEMWAAKSGGRCLFVMPVNRDWRAIAACMTCSPSCTSTSEGRGGIGL